ncbi:butyrophilin subfamily 3 member A2-like [Chiloscyllium punctatum]|uniref:butyrophilin subfamily 3 member A2-like n=1 Tax=Chiloscyllium punctatum TaxID=137246 RepID=UPI003B635850
MGKILESIMKDEISEYLQAFGDRSQAVLLICNGFPVNVLGLDEALHKLEDINSVGEFRVSGPSHPVVAIVGEDAVLECYLVPQVFVNNMVVRWFKSDIRLPVHGYRNGQDDTAAQHQAYRKRTELFQGEVSQGKSVSSAIPVTGEALGREHWIQIDGYRKNGIQLMCESNGWFPQPQISWTGGNGQNLTAQSEINYRRDSNGLVNVQSSVAVTKDATNSFKCLLQNKLLKEEQEAEIQIADGFFPSVSGWLVFLSLMLCLVIITLITGIIWIVKQLRNIKGTVSDSVTMDNTDSGLQKNVQTEPMVFVAVVVFHCICNNSVITVLVPVGGEEIAVLMKPEAGLREPSNLTFFHHISLFSIFFQ